MEEEEGQRAGGGDGGAMEIFECWYAGLPLLPLVPYCLLLPLVHLVSSVFTAASTL